MQNDIILKYMDIDSTRRNRNNYKNPYDFVIPISNINQGSTTDTLIDPVLESSPYTGSDNKQPGQLLTGVSIDAFNITLDADDSPINNYYVKKTLQIGNVFREIINYNGTTKVATLDKAFPLIPASGTIYFTRNIEIYFNTNCGINRYDINANLVYSLNILDINPNPTIDFYKGSFIRFTNGEHVGKTSLIQSYYPSGAIPSFYQSTTYGENSFISTTTEQGFVILSIIYGNIYTILLNLICFDTTLASRDLNLKIRKGKNLLGNIIIDTTLSVAANILTPTDTTFFINTGSLDKDAYYTVTLQDITVGGNSTGFISVFGIENTSSNPSIYPTYGMNTYPKHTILTIPNIGGDVIFNQPLPSTGDLTCLTPNTEQGFSVMANKTGNLFSISLLAIVYEIISTNRTILLRIRDGQSIDAPIIYSNYFSFPSFTSYEKVLAFYLNNGPNVIQNNYYTITLQDMTAGGNLTGYINIFGIKDNTNNTYNMTTLPEFTMNIKSFDILYSPTPLGYVGNNIRFGYANDLSGDSRIMAVSAPFENGNRGAVYIFTRNPDNTFFQEARLTGSSNINSYFGYSLRLSYDGNTLAIGSIGDSSNIGATFVFTRLNGVWTQSAKLVGTGYTGTPQQGYRVSINENGTTIVTGSINNNGGIGCAWVFDLISGVWTQNTRLIGSGYIGNSNQGIVDISGDGNTIALGGPRDNSDIGATWIFIKIAGIWTQQSKIIAPNYFDQPRQGTSVSLSRNGNILAIGGCTDDTYNGDVGATWIYTRNTNVWTQSAKLIGNDYVGNPQQGFCVRLHKDGNMVIVSGITDSYSLGAVWIYMNVNGIWTQIGSKIQPPNTGGGTVFGECITIANDYTIIVGGPVETSTSYGGKLFLINGNSSSNYDSPLIPQILPLTKFGFKFIPNDTGVFNSVTFKTSSFENVTGIRTFDLELRDGAGLGGTVIKTSNIIYANYLGLYDVAVTMPKETVVTGNTYTVTFIDTTPTGNNNGNIYYYGVRPNPTYVSYGVNIYPTGILTIVSVPKVLTTQPISDTIIEAISTSIEQGFRINPLTSGMLTTLTVSLSSYSSTGTRQIRVRVREGEGLLGSILYEYINNVPNILSRSDYNLFYINPPVGGAILEIGLYYTITVEDITVGGNSTGYAYIYGINSDIDYVTYNIGVFPKMFSNVPSYIIELYPPMPYNEFIGNGLDNIEFNTKAYDNLSTLRYVKPQHTRITFYEIGLEYIVIPNVVFKSAYGGKLSDYPYIYVELFNDGYKGNLDVFISNNPHSVFASFKVEIKKNLYGSPTLFYTIKPKIRKQVVAFRPDQDVRFRVKFPDGTVLANNLDDTNSPNFPNPLLQVNALFSIRPVSVQFIEEGNEHIESGNPHIEEISDIRDINRIDDKESTKTTNIKDVMFFTL